MDSDVIIEIVGYVASALIILSIAQRSILRLRLLGLAGAAVFLVYSLAIGAYPIAVVNLVAGSIHAWRLRKLVGRKGEAFRVLHVLPESRYLLDFLDFYRDEIEGRYQPEFSYRPDADQVTAFILRDMVPAGLFIGRYDADGNFEVALDYVIPQYRDFRIGRFVYSAESGLLAGADCTRAWASASNPEYARYLRKMGFTPVDGTSGRYEITLAA